MSNFQLNIPITKVDEEQRIVYGYATKEELDRQGDIVDYEASKGAFTRWAGNIREQHDGKKAVGKRVQTEFDDENKQVLIGAYISRSADGENAWTKVKEGILTGFSIGGKIYKTVRDTIKTDDGEVSADRIVDYDLAEVSLVDVPACPSAQFVMVKSADGKAVEVEEMHESEDGQPLPWFMKSFAYAPDQVNQLQKTTDNKGMEKRKYTDEQRQAMAKKGQALPDGSFPIADVEDLKNAIHAYGRASDKAAAKAFIIKRAKALGATNVLPEDWNAKGDEPEMTKEVESDKELEKVNVKGGEERDANAEVVSTEVPEETTAVDPVAVKPEKKEVTEEKKADEPEVKKGLYTVAQLAECVENLTWIVESAEFESEYEGDKSEVPAQLKAAVAQVGQALVAMTQEEVAEAAAEDDVEVIAEPVELADRPADLIKMVDEKLNAKNDEMLKALGDVVAGKVADVIKPLEDRISAIESRPVGNAPKASYAIVDKAADAAPSEYEQLLKQADALPATASVSERAELAHRILLARPKAN